MTRPAQRIAGRLRRDLEQRRRRRFIDHLREGGADLGQEVSIAPDVVVRAKVTIGRNSNLHRGCVLRGFEPIRIGRYCDLGEGVRVISSNHQMNRPNLSAALQLRVGAGDLDEKRGPVELGNNVWVGDGATILPGVTVGNGAVIAAGAIVTRPVVPFAIVVGCPARVLRLRFDEEVVAALERIAWWNWSEERILSMRSFFELDLADTDAAARLARYLPVAADA